MKNFLDYASKRYYEGNPIIEDAEFDALAKEYNYESVGASVGDGVAHTYPMYSLKKCYVGEKLIELNAETVETPKLDGAAVSLLYVEGELKLALTRGDGKRGLDITEKMKLITKTRLPYDKVPKVIQINGEVVAPKEIANARNYAAGALNLKSLEEFKSRELTFVAYSVSPTMEETYYDDMHILYTWGFYEVLLNKDYLLEQFPTDGKVIRINDNEDYKRRGCTASHPKGAYALKERLEGVTTRLNAVTWQVGRTGAVSPVAILEPVNIDGATVSRATLHNMKYIEELGLEIGCNVELIRAGEIIPRVVRRV